MRNRLFIILLILIAFVVHHEWITNLSVLTYGDWHNQALETLKQFVSFPFIWNTGALGTVDIGVSFYPFNFLSGLLAQQGIQYGVIERALFMWPIIIAFPVFSYLLIKKNVHNSVAAIIGSFVYSYNTYFSEIKTGHLTLLMSYALAPLVFLCFQKALEKKDIKYALLAGVFGFIASFYEFRGFYILCLILFFYFIYYLFVIERVKNIYGFIKTSFFAGLPAFVCLLLNLYWLLPFEKTGVLSSNIIFDRSLFGNEFLNINYAITLFHPFWTGSKTAIFVVQNIPIYFWLIPLFAFLGLFLNRKNKNILFFGLVSILGIFLTKQVGHPFIDVYLWLYKHFPGFNAFREASKFYFVIAFGYSILIADFINWIWKNWKNTKWQIIGKYALTIAIAAIFLWNTKPFITGEIATLFVPRQIPADYLVVNDFLLKQNDYFRTLWIPGSSKWAVYTNDHPEVNITDIIDGAWNYSIKDKESDKITEAELSIDSLTFSYSSNFLNQSSIKYVMVPLEDKANDDDFFVYGKSRQYYINKLNKISYVHKINIGTKDIVVYENANYKPHIYATNNQELINKNQEYKTVNFKFVNPTEYEINLKNIAGPTYLNFSEAYHPSWKLRVGQFNWLDVLTKKNYFLPDKYHFENDASLNSYLINPETVCKVSNVKSYKVENGCVRNKDGSYDISDITLYFAQQSYMYLGLIISGGTLIIVLCLLSFTFGRTISSRAGFHFIRHERKK